MANIKISALPTSSTRAQSDVIPIVVSGVTKQITVANFLGLSATAPIVFTAATGVISLSTVPFSSGGTGTTTQALAASALGIRRISPAGGHSNYDHLSVAPAYETQVGVDYYGNKHMELHFAGSTTLGDWAHGISIPHGIENIGDPDRSDSTLLGITININGNPANWSKTGDQVVTIKNWTSNVASSGTQLNLGVMTAGVGVSAFAISNGGTGYTVGDQLTITGGTKLAPSGYAGTLSAICIVTTVSSGVITGLAFFGGGEYTVAPSSPASCTGGTGTGATITLTTTVKAITAMADNSSSYVHVPSTGGSGLISGNGYVVMNYHATYNKGWAVAAPGGATGAPDAGNFSLQYNDFGNKMFRVPFWVASAYQPTDAGWADTFTASASTGNCTVKNAITVGSLKYATQPTAALVFASPTGSTGDPTFRALVAGDIPNLDSAKITTGTIGTARLGSGAASASAYLLGNQTWGTDGSFITGLTATQIPNIQFAKILTGASTGIMTYQQDSIGTTPTYPALLTNTSAAAVGAQQCSPGLRFSGSGWKTTATAGAQSVDFRIYLLPVQGTANPTSLLSFDSSVNGSGFASAMSLSDTGVLTTAGAITASTGSITCGSGNGFIVSGRSQIKSSANAAMSFLNNAATACSSITYLETSVTKTTAYTVLATDAGTAFDNIGAGSEVVFTLPAASKGLHFSIIVQNAVGCKFTATGAATIRDGGSVSASNGSIDSTTVGSCLHIVAISGSEWYVDCKNGTWNAPV